MEINEDRLTSPLVFFEKTLSYSGQDCRRIPSSLSKMYGDKVECLDISYNSLMTVDGLSGFPSLRDLVLDNNRLVDVRPLPHLPRLATLSLNNNLITNLEGVLTRIAEQLPNLIYLSLLGNPACPDQLSDRDKDDADYQRYRYYVLHHLPGLKFLDYRQVSSEEKSEARRRGQFLRVRRPTSLSTALTPSTYSYPLYTALPLLHTARPQHKGAYGKCLYKYSGKHSEGNRFICNADL